VNVKFEVVDRAYVIRKQFPLYLTSEHNQLTLSDLNEHWMLKYGQK